MTTPQFQKHILAWYKENRRDMPWRNTKNPYKILVSEIMLQQTQVSRVLPKYQEFLQEFPTITALAKAPNRKVLAAWKGLGYWKRALNLKETAKIVAKKYKGKFPKDPKELEKLPGIGKYTAGAVSCFAFGNNEPFLDTNIRRVYLHFFFTRKKNVTDKEILEIAQRALSQLFYDRRKVVTTTFNSREWHYALFDYGATQLKDKKINKKSKHYTKQSKFAGSFRSFRTKVMRFLLEQPKQIATKTKIQRLLKKEGSPYSADKILAALLKDNLIKKQKNSFSL